MGAVATFDPAAFSARYPELAATDPALLKALFVEAGLYLANNGTGPVTDPAMQAALMGMLVAHLVKLSVGASGAAPSDLVGRISSATEGSVSVTADVAGVPGSAAWFAQTRYGFAFWQATARFRSMRYVPGPRTSSIPYPFALRT